MLRPWRCTFGVAFFAFVCLSACDCGRTRLQDASCHPGDPDAGRDSDGRERDDIPELCNGIDDNCNGVVDEGCECVPGEKKTCGSDVGACRSTTVDCEDGHFPICEAAVGPTAEDCDGIDNDCDGVVDGLDEEACWEGALGASFTDTPCKMGIRHCQNGAWSACNGQVLDGKEECDGVDNDCNEAVDDNTVLGGVQCGYSGVGACRLGVYSCVNTEYVCGKSPDGGIPAYPQNESCDNVDNDCDGATDEDLYRPCGSACGAGTERCVSGQWSGCTARQPVTEVCDPLGMDENCDGMINEGCACIQGSIQFCRSNIVDQNGNPKNCGRGTQECGAQGQWGQCTFFGTTVEVCDSWDNDCDGTVDGLSRSCGDPSTAGVGTCKLGNQSCATGAWGACVDAVGPKSEICNTKDDDCDGLVDENLTPHNRVDMCFAVDISGSMCTYYSALAQAMASYVQDFSGTDHRFCLVTFPPVSGAAPYTVVVNLTTVGAFQSAVAALNCNGGGWEPSYDTVKDMATWNPANVPPNPLGIAWRSNAYPYIVVMTDEDAQTWTGTSYSDVAQAEADAAAKTTNCQLPGCQTGDKVEIYVFTMSYYQSYWDTVVYGETAKRIKNIDPPDKDRYTGLLRDVFTNVCLPSGP